MWNFGLGDVWNVGLLDPYFSSKLVYFRCARKVWVSERKDGWMDGQLLLSLFSSLLGNNFEREINGNLWAKYGSSPCGSTKKTCTVLPERKNNLKSKYNDLNLRLSFVGIMISAEQLTST